MPDGLHERDFLAWSEHQADLLRRLGRGELVNDVDWAQLAEEVEDLGLSQLHSVESFLALIMVNLLKLRAWPESDARNHWRGEIVGFQYEARKRFTPSMRQKIDLGEAYAYAITRLEKECADAALPAEDPFTLDDLLNEDGDALLVRLAAAP
jgi:hypothetical protein